MLKALSRSFVLAPFACKAFAFKVNSLDFGEYHMHLIGKSAERNVGLGYKAGVSGEGRNTTPLQRPA